MWPILVFLILMYKADACVDSHQLSVTCPSVEYSNVFIDIFEYFG